MSDSSQLRFEPSAEPLSYPVLEKMNKPETLCVVVACLALAALIAGGVCFGLDKYTSINTGFMGQTVSSLTMGGAGLVGMAALGVKNLIVRREGAKNVSLALDLNLYFTQRKMSGKEKACVVVACLALAALIAAGVCFGLNKLTNLNTGFMDQTVSSLTMGGAGLVGIIALLVKNRTVRRERGAFIVRSPSARPSLTPGAQPFGAMPGGGQT